MKKKYYWLIIAVILIAVSLWLSLKNNQSTPHATKHVEETKEIALGPHHGRVFHKDGFAIEVLIDEKNMPPRFRVYPSFDGKVIPPQDIQLSIDLERIDGGMNKISFKPHEDSLLSQEVIQEPHSFDVTMKATYRNKTYYWAFASYEGRTELSEDTVKESGIEIATAGPGDILKYLPLNGRITLNRNTTTEVKARFPGVVKEVRVQWGDKVKKGDLLAIIESNESLQDYKVYAPMDGRILMRNISAGNVAGSESLFTIANLADVWAELHVFPRDLEKINEGQLVTIHSQEEEKEVEVPIAMILPTTDPLSQTVIAIAVIANPGHEWRPGTIVTGDVLVSKKTVPVRVKLDALQNNKEASVVFIQKGDQYEMKEIELGEKNSQWAEVKNGLNAGTNYVITNSFIIKADIEKAGAEHDH